MKRRFRALSVGAVVVLTIVGWIIVRSRPVPMHRGKPESYWINSLGYPGANPLRVDLGSNAVPLLLRAVARRDDRFQAIYKSVWVKLPILVSKRLPPPTDPRAIRTNAAMILRSVADTPTLVRVLKSNPDPLVRGYMTDGLIVHYDNDATVALIEALDDKDPRVRASAALGLSATQREKEAAAIPALVRCAHDKDEHVRFFTWGALGAYFEAGQPVVPELEKALRNPDPAVSNAVAEMLRKISP